MSKFAYNPQKTFSWDNLTHHVLEDDNLLDRSHFAKQLGLRMTRNHPEGVREWQGSPIGGDKGLTVMETEAKHTGEAVMKFLKARKRSGLE